MSHAKSRSRPCRYRSSSKPPETLDASRESVHDALEERDAGELLIVGEATRMCLNPRRQRGDRRRRFRRARRIVDQRELHHAPWRFVARGILLEIAADDRRCAVDELRVRQCARPRAVEQPFASKLSERFSVDPDEARRSGPAAERLAFGRQRVDELGTLSLHGLHGDAVLIAHARRDPPVDVGVDRRVAPPHPPHDRRPARLGDDAVP